MSRPPLPPFDHDSAMLKVRLAEDGWNSRDPARVALAYTEDSVWRNRSSSRLITPLTKSCERDSSG